MKKYSGKLFILRRGYILGVEVYTFLQQVNLNPRGSHVGSSLYESAIIKMLFSITVYTCSLLKLINCEIQWR